MPYNSLYSTFWKRQNYRDRKEVDVCQGLTATGRVGYKGLEGTLWGVGTVPSRERGGGCITACVYSNS